MEKTMQSTAKHKALDLKKRSDIKIETTENDKLSQNERVLRIKRINDEFYIDKKENSDYDFMIEKSNISLPSPHLREYFYNELFHNTANRFIIIILLLIIPLLLLFLNKKVDKLFYDYLYAHPIDESMYESTIVNPSEELNSFYETGIVFPDSSSRFLSSEEIESLEYDYSNSLEVIQYAINEIYAREGYEFNSPEWKNYYSQFSWYHSLGFSEKETRDRFNEYENENIINLLKKREQIRSRW